MINESLFISHSLTHSQLYEIKLNKKCKFNNFPLDTRRICINVNDVDSTSQQRRVPSGLVLDRSIETLCYLMAFSGCCACLFTERGTCGTCYFLSDCVTL